MELRPDDLLSMIRDIEQVLFKNRRDSRRTEAIHPACRYDKIYRVMTCDEIDGSCPCHCCVKQYLHCEL